MTLWVVILFVGAAPWCEAERAEDSPLPGDELSWLDEKRESLLFIPQALFDHRHLEELPLGTNSSLDLRLDVKRHPEVYRRQFASGSVPECWPSRGGTTQGTDPEPRTLRELLEVVSIVQVGTVRRIVPGWDARSGRVARMAVVGIEDGLRARGSDAQPEVGEEVFFLRAGGHLSVDGTELCEEPTPGIYQPQVGDRVLLGGRFNPSNPALFEGYVFPIEEGLVLPQPFPALEAQQDPVELHDLARSLRQPDEDLRDHP